MSTSADGRRSLPEIHTDRLDAVIFDLDGVLTDTATMHAAAWKQTLDTFPRGSSSLRGGQRSFRSTQHDYDEYVDGKTRHDGVASFLASRGIQLPAAGVTDPPDRRDDGGLANRKNELVLAAIRRDGVEPFPALSSSLTAVRERVCDARHLGEHELRQRARAAGIATLFEVRVDGVERERELGLSGKPDPAVFLRRRAARRRSPLRAAVFEDALAGVEAGRRRTLRAGRSASTGLDTPTRCGSMAPTPWSGTWARCVCRQRRRATDDRPACGTDCRSKRARRPDRAANRRPGGRVVGAAAAREPLAAEPGQARAESPPALDPRVGGEVEEEAQGDDEPLEAVHTVRRVPHERIRERGPRQQKEADKRHDPALKSPTEQVREDPDEEQRKSRRDQREQGDQTGHGGDVTVGVATGIPREVWYQLQDRPAPTATLRHHQVWGLSLLASLSLTSRWHEMVAARPGALDGRVTSA